MWALGQIGDARAVKPLVAALRDPDYKVYNGGRMVQEAAAWALGQISDARAVAPLVGALWDAPMRIREAAAQALKSLGWQPGNDTERTLAAIARHDFQEVVSLGAAAVDTLIAMLRGSDEGVRQIVAQALGKIRDTRAVEPLLAMLKDENESVAMRIIASQALAEIGDTRAVEALLAMLKDENAFLPMRIKATQALGKIGDTRAVEPLVAVIEDKHADVEHEARITFDYHVKWRLEDNYRAHQVVRQAAAQALGEIEDTRAVKPLVFGLQDNEQDVRRAAREALERIGPKTVESMIAMLQESLWSLCSRIRTGTCGTQRWRYSEPCTGNKRTICNVRGLPL
jgi:HEAT repeat protein